jgi:DNA topoisomerase-1
MTEDNGSKKPKTRSAKTKKKHSVKAGKPLVIVESKAKARTVARYLGRAYNVKACLGHVRDLPKTSLGIDLEHDFKPNYVTNRDRREIVQDIKDAAKKASQIFIATDPDREGEAIAWHLNHILKKPEITRRVEFNEVTRKAVKQAISEPREIDINRVNAQQARRILDRLVGYNLSPYLWRELASGLSAGRVQSVATKLICDREEDIDKFVPVEYWTIDGMFRKTGDETDAYPSFKSNLVRIDGEPMKIGESDEAGAAVRELAEQDFKVGSVITKTITKRPYAPFITSTLQQEASKRLGFTARKTMTIAQQLYEGIDVGEGGEEGLITYMRTDSVRVSDEAVKLARELITETFGAKYLPEKPNVYKSKEELIAEEFLPEQHFTKPPPRYTTASLVKTLEEQGIGRPSTYAPTITTIIDRKYVKREGQTFHPTDLGKEVNKLLLAKFSDIINEGFTAQMEDNLDLVQSGEKGWVDSVKEFYTPFLVNLREALDMECPKCQAPVAIRNGRYGAFFACTRYPDCDWRASISPKKQAEAPEVLDEKCPQCGKDLVLKHGRYGKFAACTGFPECRFTQSIEDSKDEPGTSAEGGGAKREIKYAELPCPKCGSRMILRRSRSGRFWGCEKYPDCDGIRPYTIGVKCPRDGCDGEYVERRTRKGKIFYGCSKYPECTETSWTFPGKRDTSDDKEKAPDSAEKKAPDSAEPGETSDASSTTKPSE